MSELFEAPQKQWELPTNPEAYRPDLRGAGSPAVKRGGKTLREMGDEVKAERAFREETAFRTGQELTWRDASLLYDLRKNGVIDNDDIYRYSASKKLGDYLGLDFRFVNTFYDEIWEAVSGDLYDRYKTPKSRAEAISASVQMAKNLSPMMTKGVQLMNLHGQLDGVMNEQQGKKLQADADKLWAEIQALQEANKELGRGMPGFGDDPLSFIITSTIQSAPATTRTVAAGIAGAAIVGAVGAIAGAAAGGAGAAPGFIGGAKIGYSLASFAVSSADMAGLMYVDLLAAGVEQKNARALAAVAGGINGFIESGLGTVAGWGKSAVKAVGGKVLSKEAVKKISETASKNFIMKMANSGMAASLGRNLAVKTLIETAKQAGEEGLEEVLQYLVEQATTALGDALQDAPVDRNSWGSREFWAGMGDSLLGGIAGGVGFGIAGLPLTVTGNVHETARQTTDLKMLAIIAQDKAEFIAAAKKESPLVKGLGDEQIGQMYDSQAAERNEYYREEAARAGRKLASLPTLEAPGEMRTKADGRYDVRVAMPEGDASTGTMTLIDEPTGQRMGGVDFSVDIETNTITIEGVNLSKAITNTEAVIGGMVKELAYANPNMGIVFEPDARMNEAAGIDLAALKNRLIEANPRGAENGLQYYQEGDEFGLTREIYGDIEKIARLPGQSMESARDNWKVMNTARKLGMDVHEMIQGIMTEEELRAKAAENPQGVEAEAAGMLDSGRLAAQQTGQRVGGGIIAIRRGVNGEPDQILYGNEAMKENFDRLRAITVITDNADPATLLHEWMHWMTSFVIPNSPQYRALLEEAVGKAFGKDIKMEGFTKEHHEWLSKNFEHYLKTGEAPTAGLRALFRRMAEALKQLFTQWTGNPELKRYFDELLAEPEGGNRQAAESPGRARVQTDNEQQKAFAEMNEAERIAQGDLYTREEKAAMLYAMADNNFKNELKKVQNGTINPGLSIPVGAAPEAYVKKGLPNNNIFLPATVVTKATATRHTVGMDVIERLPELLNSPVMILKSLTDPKAFVTVIDAVDNEGRPVIVAQKPTLKKTTTILSIYGRNNFDSFIKNCIEQDKVIAADKKKAIKYVSPQELQSLKGTLLDDLSSTASHNSESLSSGFEKDFGILQQIIGERGAQALDKAEEATARIDNLAVARQMEEAGKDAGAVRMATGWERGADGKWRYEIGDIKLAAENMLDLQAQKMEANPDDKRLRHKHTLDDIVTDDAGLFTAYPWLQNMPLKFKVLKGGLSGQYDGSSISVDPGLSGEKLRSTLTHEIQHAIQDIEGFAKGGSPKGTDKFYRDKAVEIINNNFDDQQIEALKKWRRARKLLEYEINRYMPISERDSYSEVKELRQRIKEADDAFIEATGKEAFDILSKIKTSEYDWHSSFLLYNSLGGEVEARNAQERMGFTAAKRLETLLAETEDVSREDQIIIENGLQTAMAMEGERLARDVSAEPEETRNTPSRAWAEGFPNVTHFIDAENKLAKPWKELTAHPDYDAAKNHENREAAERLVRDFLKGEEQQRQIRELAEKHPDAIVVPVHAEEEKSRNRIPSALAGYISENTGLKLDEGIVQTNKVTRTGKESWYRFAFRPKFRGEVVQGGKYILVDDVFSNGGAFSELKRHIELNGGEVVATAAMATGGHGEAIALSEKTRLDLEQKFGIESLQRFLQEEGLYGGNYQSLTEPEGYALLRAETLDGARDRIAYARQEGGRGLLPGSVQGPQGDVSSQEINSPDTFDILFQEAYQGSPYWFDKHDNSYVGSGFGNLRHGWGHYLYGRKEAAQWFGQSVSKLKGVEGQLYHVDIPGDNELLHWEKALSEQPEAVRQAADKLIAWDKNGKSNFNEAYNVREFNDGTYGFYRSINGKMKWGTVEEAQAAAKAEIKKTLTGKEFYNTLAESVGAKETSLLLDYLGVKGAKYFDKSVEKIGVPKSYNYVIYGDSDINILQTFYSEAFRDAEFSEFISSYPEAVKDAARFESGAELAEHYADYLAMPDEVYKKAVSAGYFDALARAAKGGNAADAANVIAGVPAEKAAEGLAAYGAGAGTALEAARLVRGKDNWQGAVELLEKAGVPRIDAEAYADTARAFARSDMLWLEREAAEADKETTTEAAIEKITRLLAKEKDTSKGVQKEIIGKAGNPEIALLKKELGIDASEYSHTLDKSEINHAIKNHGNEKTEAQRGQIAITEDDFKLIPYILKNPDTLEYSGKNDKGLDAIKYGKELDGIVIIVEEVRTGKKELAFNTMYKKKKGSGGLQKPSALTSETTSLPKISPETGELSRENTPARPGAEDAAERKFYDTLVDGAKTIHPDGHLEALRAELAGEPRTADAFAAMIRTEQGFDDLMRMVYAVLKDGPERGESDEETRRNEVVYNRVRSTFNPEGNMNWKAALDDVAAGRRVNDHTKKIIQGMIRNRPLQYMEAWAMMTDDDTWLPQRPDLERIRRLDTEGLTDEEYLERQSPEELERIARRLSSDRIKEKIDNKTLKVDDPDLNDYERQLREQMARAQELIAQRKEGLKDYRRMLENAERNARKEQLLLEQQSTDTSREGLAAGREQAKKTAIAVGEVKRVADEMESFMRKDLTPAQQAAFLELRKQLKERERIQAELKAVDEIRVIKKQDLRQILRRPDLKTVNVAEARLIEWIQAHFDSYEAVAWYIGKGAKDIRQLYNEFATNPEYREKLKKNLEPLAYHAIERIVFKDLAGKEVRAYGELDARQRKSLFKYLADYQGIFEELGIDVTAGPRKFNPRDWLALRDEVKDMMPPDTLAKLEGLLKEDEHGNRERKVDDLTLEDLQTLAGAVNKIRKEGREKKQARMEARAQLRQEAREKIQAVLEANMPKGADKERMKGIAETRMEEEKKSGGKSVWYALHNARRFFRRLEGWADGYLHGYFTQREYDAFDAENLHVFERKEKTEKLLKEEGIDIRDLARHTFAIWNNTRATLDEMLTFYYAQYNDRALNAVVFGNFATYGEREALRAAAEDANVEGQMALEAGIARRYWDDMKKLDAFFAQEGNEKYRRVLDIIGGDYEGNYERLKEFVALEYNEELGSEPYYMPLLRLAAVAQENTEVEQALADSGLSRYISKGFTKGRVDIPPWGQAPVRAGFYETWDQMVVKQEHLMAYDPLMRELKQVFEGRGSETLRDTLRRGHSEEAVKYVRTFISELGAPPVQEDLAALNKISRIIRGHFPAAVLGWRMASILKQAIESPPPFFQYVNPKEYIAAGISCLRQETRDMIREKSVYMKVRHFDPAAAVIRQMEQMYLGGKLGKAEEALARIENMGMKGQEWIDAVCVMPGWLAAYNRELSRLNEKEGHLSVEEADAKAVRYADGVMRDCQPSSVLMDQAAALKGNKNPLARMFFQFQTPIASIFQQLFMDAPANFKQGRVLNALWTWGIYALVAIAVGAIKDDDDDDKKAKNRAIDALVMPVEMIPVFGGDIAYSVETFLRTGRARTPQRSYFPVIDQGIKTGNALSAKKWGKAAWEAVKGFGYYSGLPVGLAGDVEKSAEAGAWQRMLGIHPPSGAGRKKRK